MARKRRARNAEIPHESVYVGDVSASSGFNGTDYHAHCPTCGMMARIERFAEAPHEVQTYFHGYGGPVYQHWEEAPEYREEALRMMLAHIEETRAYLMGELGMDEEEEIEEPEEEEELIEDQAEAMDALAEEKESDEEDEFPEWPEGQEEMGFEEEEGDE